MREIADAAKAKGEIEGKMAELQTTYMVGEQQLKDPAALDMMVDEMLAGRSEHEHDESGADGARSIIAAPKPA